MIGSIFAGLAAGAVGALAQTAFFTATKKIAPAPPKEAFSPPEEQQRGEMATQTVARRVVEGMMQRPLENKELGGQIVHYTFGSLWGGVYGLVHGPRPSFRGPLGALAFSTLVWGLSDNVILPAFRLSAWPQAYPMKSHAYALAAHVVYGAAVWGSYELLRPSTMRSLGSLLVAAWLTRNLPSSLRAPARRVLANARTARRRGMEIAQALS